MGRRKRAEKLIEQIQLIPVSSVPGDSDMLDPDMELFCLYCSKRFKPYNMLVNQDFAYTSFCSDRCMRIYHTYWGKFRRLVSAFISFIFWRPLYKVEDWWYGRKAPICSTCKVKTTHIFNGELFNCPECFGAIERRKVSKEEMKKHLADGWRMEDD